MVDAVPLPGFGQAGAPSRCWASLSRPSRGQGLWCGLDGGEDLQGVVVEVVHLAGDESFGVSFGAGAPRTGAQVLAAARTP